MARKINPNLAELFDQQQQNLFCDVTLVATADGTGIRAHRNVLHTASMFFKNLLTAEMDASNLAEIRMNGVSGAALRQLVGYAYTQEVNIDAANVLDILATADFFLLDSVVELCKRMYQQLLNTTNAFRILAVAKKYRLNDLEQSARNFAFAKFSHVFKCDEEFLGLDEQTVAGFLGSDDLVVDSEEDVYNAIAKWIEADPEGRKQHYAALMKTVRLSKIEYKFLMGRIQDWSKEMDLEQVFADACKAKCHQCVVAKRAPPSEYLFVATGQTKGRTVVIQRYSIATNTWEYTRRIIDMDHAQIHCINNCLYFFEDDHNPRWTLVKYRVKCIKLDTMKLETSRTYRQILPSEFVSVAVGQYVYCIGGRKVNAPQQLVVRYDTQNEEWHEFRMLNRGRISAGAAVLAGKIYVVGGYNDICLKSVEPKTNMWTNVAELNVGRYGHRCCTINGAIYAVGGDDGTRANLNSIEKYDALLDRWTIIDHVLSVPDSHLGVAAIGNWIYIAHGKANGLERINVLDGRIEKLSSMIHELYVSFATISP